MFYKLSYLQRHAKCYNVKSSKINIKTISVKNVFEFLQLEKNA